MVLAYNRSICNPVSSPVTPSSIVMGALATSKALTRSTITVLLLLAAVDMPSDTVDVDDVVVSGWRCADTTTVVDDDRISDLCWS